MNWPDKFDAFVAICNEVGGMFGKYPALIKDSSMARGAINKNCSLVHVIAAGDTLNTVISGARLILWSKGKNTTNSLPAIKRYT